MPAGANIAGGAIAPGHGVRSTVLGARDTWRLAAFPESAEDDTDSGGDQQRFHGLLADV